MARPSPESALGARPLLGELIRPEPGQLTRARVTTLAVAAAPLLARLGWWWWSQSRQRSRASRSPLAAATSVERTEIEMERRRLGRWRVKVVSTRWQAPGRAPRRSLSPAPLAGRWLSPLWRVTTLGLEGGARGAELAPRLPAAPTPPPE